MTLTKPNFLKDTFDRVRNASQDYAVGFYMPAVDQTETALKRIGSGAMLTTPALMLGGAYVMPFAPALSIGLFYGAAISKLITHACFAERGREARLQDQTPR